MFEDDIRRREAMERLLKIVAFAAGLSLTDLKELLAFDGSGLKLSQLKQKHLQQRQLRADADFALKALKVIVEQDPRVFDSEFGRLTPGNLITDMQVRPGSMPGGIDFGVQGITNCGEFYSTGGQGCSDLDACNIYGCTPNGGEGGGTGGTGCDGIHVCSPDDCDQDSCSKKGCYPDECDLEECDQYESNIVSNEVFERYRSHAYVQDLMQRFHTTNLTQLSNRVSHMVNQRRQHMLQHQQMQQPQHMYRPGKKP